MRRFVVPKCHVCRPKLVPRLWGRGSVLLIPLPMPGSCARAGFQSPHRRLVSLLAFWSKLPPDFICQLNLQEFLARFSVRHNLDHLASLLTHALLLSPLVTGILALFAGGRSPANPTAGRVGDHVEDAACGSELRPLQGHHRQVDGEGQKQDHCGLSRGTERGSREHPKTPP